MRRDAKEVTFRLRFEAELAEPGVLGSEEISVFAHVYNLKNKKPPY